MNDGWVKLHRKILDWEWFGHINTQGVFIYLLLAANIEDKKWQGIEIKRGQLVTSALHLQKLLHLSRSAIRNSLNNLQHTHEIAIKTNKHYTLITINNYDQYQGNGHPTTNQTAIQRPTGQPLLKNKENKNKEEKTYTSENLTLEQVAERINEAFNFYLGRKFKGIDSFKSNLEYWLGTYEPKEIATAIQNAKYDSFFKDKLTPTMLFRKKNPRGECVDYISQLLIKQNNERKNLV